MALALFVPLPAREHFEQLVTDEDLWVPRSWSELDSLAPDSAITAAVVDPGADGEMKVGSVVRLMTNNPTLPVFAYVPATPWHLKAVFYLSKHGLKDVFLYPLLKVDLRFLKTVKAAGANGLTFEFLGKLEPGLESLPPELAGAVQDLFDRPHRYERADDIATQAGVSVKRLYRRFNAARIGTPSKLITAAKVLRGYSTLRSRALTVGETSRAIGFDHYKQFRDRTSMIFGRSPRRLRAEANSDQILLRLVEWLATPSSSSHPGLGYLLWAAAEVALWS